jgi:anti-sigma regulatory factor (Ser/Thr protein kinase)/GNAT superfamily N-acetyltransferase
MESGRNSLSIPCAPHCQNHESPPTTGLFIPADKRYLNLLLGYVTEICRIVNLSDTDLFHLEVASEEAFINIVEHAYPDCKPGNIYIEARIKPTELVLSFRDEGIPFHDSPKEYPLVISSDGDIQSPHGLGFQIMRNTVDEVRMENLGKMGKVLHLIKRYPAPVEIEMAQNVHEIPEAPFQQYSIRPMQTQDASQVCRLFWLVYGYTYKNENFYRPEGLIDLNDNGRIISYVAVGEDNDVVGHVGLIRPEPVLMAEFGLLAVSPAHRGRGLMGQLEDAIFAKAEEMNLVGLSINAVTSHPKSQKSAVKKDFVPCSIDLAACPPRMFKALVSDSVPAQRESYLHGFKYFNTPPPRTVYVPKRHHNFVHTIYSKMQQSCTFSDPTPARTPGDYKIHYDRTLQKGIITVISADERQWPEIQRVVDDMVHLAGAEVVDLDLPVSQPATTLLFDLAESAGFIFTGIRPCQAPDGDCFRLQFLSIPFDLTHIQLYPNYGEFLLEYITTLMK